MTSHLSGSSAEDALVTSLAWLRSVLWVLTQADVRGAVHQGKDEPMETASLAVLPFCKRQRLFNSFSLLISKCA